MTMDPETVTRIGEPQGDGTDGNAGQESWWERYRAALKNGGLTPSAIRIVDLDAEYIAHNGVYGAGIPGAQGSTWPASRLRRGLAMGSVQSGKTASMLGVAAKALDCEVSIVVLLAGTRVALWRQTYERAISQLDGWTPDGDTSRRAHRVLLPSPRTIVGARGSVELEGLYFEHPNLSTRMLVGGHSLIAIVMKHADHLMRFAKYLHKVLATTLPRMSRPLHLLVFDDEADDGSILDAVVESGLAPDALGLKQIPRHIARLWSGGASPNETFHEKLFVTYLGYTATPQSNFLQSDHNPLSPSDFVVALRTPLDTGSVEPPRMTTFNEPEGLGRYYTGGELFYRRFADDPGALCRERHFPERAGYATSEDFDAAVTQARADMLSDSLRAYFVAGALRLLIANRRLTAVRSAAPDSRDAIERLTPEPHSMLYHPSSRIDEHFAAAVEVSAWSAMLDSDDPGVPRDALGNPTLSVQGLTQRLVSEEGLWRDWLGRFEHTRHRLSFLPGGHVFPRVEEARWPEVRAILENDVFPHTRLAIINSDPRADDRPRFEPETVGDGRFLAARDIYTIFVSGNVMARGLTLEGLTTTLFLRSANEAVADTQMQMQRWFGYRGRYLCWCRVFIFKDQLDLFRAYHESDEALRREICGEMNAHPGAAPGPLVFQGTRFHATGKIANLRALPLCPGSDPFVRVIETGRQAPANAGLLAKLLTNEHWSDVTVAGRLRGRAMDRQLTLIEVAELLESFRYSDHDPSPSAADHDRWRAIQSAIGLESPEAPLFRPPGIRSEARDAVTPPHCPYSIAAYLRLWSALLSRRARGFYPTDDWRTPWSMIDLSLYARTAPQFYVGIRFGSAGRCCDPILAPFQLLRMDRSSDRGVLRSTWGSRNPGEGDSAYLGDQLFDYHVHGGDPPKQLPGEPLWRPRGAPGLVLFHIIRSEDQTMADAVTVGLGLPAGGPDHIAALRPTFGT